MQKGIAVPLDYSKLAGISSDEEEGINSAVTESRTSDPVLEDTTSMYMA